MRWPQDLATRYGGEEFCAVLPETGEEGAMTVAERIRISVETEPVTRNRESLNLTVSIGINVNVPASDAGATEFFAIADKALYQAKSNGRNCSVRLE